MKLKSIILILPIFIIAFSPADKKLIAVQSYYDLRLFKKAIQPQEIEIIKIKKDPYFNTIISRGLLLTYKNRNAEDIKIAGDFSCWKPVKMTRGKHAVWYFFLANTKGSNLMRYKFIVDGLWITDPMNYNKIDDGNGSYVSIVNSVNKKEGKNISFKIIDDNLIEFRIYKPEAKLISLVGDFNHWNPENDLLTKGNDDIWRLNKRLPNGIYRYKFIIDGQWTPDIFNEKTLSDNNGGICSILEVE